MKTRTRNGTRAIGAVFAATAFAVTATTVSTAGAESSPSVTVSADTLIVSGTEDADRIALLLAPGAPRTILVDLDLDGIGDTAFDRATFSSIDVSLRNGDDVFRVNQANGAFPDETLVVHGGNGDDVLDGGDGAETFVAGPGDDLVDGNRGADTGELGAGDDTFRWDPGDGSDRVEGSQGFDAMRFIGAAAGEVMTLSADGRDALFVRDPGNVRMDMNRVERLQLETLGGPDGLTVGDLSATDLTDVDVDLSLAGAGDGIVDAVTVHGTTGDDAIEVRATSGRVEVEGLASTTRISSADAVDRLVVSAGEGDDDIHVDAAAASIMTVIGDAGSGEL